MECWKVINEKDLEEFPVLINYFSREREREKDTQRIIPVRVTCTESKPTELIVENSLNENDGDILRHYVRM